MQFDFSKNHHYNNENLYATEYQIKLRVDALNELILDDESSILKLKLQLNNFLKQEQQKDFEEQLIDRELTINNIIIQKRYSNCILIFSVFEGILKEICTELDKNKKNKINLSDLRGYDDLSRFKTYLTKVIEINFIKIEPSFTKIKQQKIVRNKITHNNGKIISKNKIQIIDGLIIKNNNLIIEGKPYFDYLINNIKEFLKELLIEIDLKTK